MHCIRIIGIKWGDKLLYTGLFFILLGLYLIIEDIYDIVGSFKSQKIIKKANFTINEYYKLKVAIGIFSVVIGIFSLINHFS